MLYHFGLVLYSVPDCMTTVKNVEFKLCGLHNTEQQQ